MRLALCSLICLAALAGCHTHHYADKGVVITGDKPVILKRGSTQQVTFNLERKGFNDPVLATLCELPTGVTASNYKQTIDGNAVTFDLAASPSAPLAVNYRGKLAVVASHERFEYPHWFAVTVDE